MHLIGGGMVASWLVTARLWIQQFCLSPGQGHYLTFLGKTLNSHSASLHLDVHQCTILVYNIQYWGNTTMD